MEIKIKGKEYHFNMNTQVGPYYHYEVTFGSNFQDDLAMFTPTVSMVRFIYAILLTDNPGFNFTFEEWLKEVSDEQIAELSKFIENRFNVLNQTKEEQPQSTADDGKKD